MIAREYARDPAHDPPEWVEVAYGCIVLNFVRRNDGVRISSRFSLKEGRGNTYLAQNEYTECRRMAQSLLHPHRRRHLPPPHWMDEREDD